MNLFAIGDAQGCHQQVLTLLDRIRARCPQPELVFLGDMVNRGPDSLSTLREIRRLGSFAKVVLGNHDLHLLAAAHDIRKQGRTDTIGDILAAPDRADLLDWLRTQPLARYCEGYLMVHAGVLPQWSVEQTLELAHEVETVLRSSDWLDFLREMYGNSPAQWSDTLTGAERLRCIVNALTRMRYCHPDGTMSFSTPESAAETPAGLVPWFDLPGRQTENVTVVFGHWSTLGLVMRPNLIGIDTGCIWGGKLTAVQLPERELIQVACPQHQVPG